MAQLTFEKTFELDERTDMDIFEAALNFIAVYDSTDLIPLQHKFESIIRNALFNIRRLQGPGYADQDITEFIAKNEDTIKLARHRLNRIEEFNKNFYESLAMKA